MISLAERHHIIRIERIIDSQFRIINKHRPAMSRHVYFRNNLHMAGSSISHQILQFFLRIESASSFQLAKLHGIVCSLLGSKPRIFLYFHPPSLVVRQMKMQGIHLVKRHDVNILLQHINRIECTADILHISSPLEARLVIDLKRRHGNVTFQFFFSYHFGRHQLCQCLRSVEESCQTFRPDNNSFITDIQRICLRRTVFLRQIKHDAILPFYTGHLLQLQLKGKRTADRLNPQFSDLSGSRSDIDYCSGGKHKSRFTRFLYRQGFGNYTVFCGLQVEQSTQASPDNQ